MKWSLFPFGLLNNKTRVVALHLLQLLVRDEEDVLLLPSLPEIKNVRPEWTEANYVKKKDGIQTSSYQGIFHRHNRVFIGSEASVLNSS